MALYLGSNKVVVNLDSETYKIESNTSPVPASVAEDAPDGVISENNSELL